ncbi:MAG: response regulator [bacterium]|nr:response regulator [bacterium]
MYKVLLTGSNRTIINEFFTYLDSYFECMSTSDRYDDIVNHIKYVRPDIFVYCLFKEKPDDLKRFSNIERQITSRNIPLAIVGDFNDCNEFSKMVPQIDPLVLQKPISIQNIAAAIIDLLKKRKEAEGTAAGNIAPDRAVPGAPGAGGVVAQGAAGAGGAAAQGAAGAGGAVAQGSAGAGSAVAQGAAGAGGAAVPGAAGAGGAAVPGTAGIAVSDRDYAASPQAVRRKKHILIVDDDSRVLRMLKGYLAERYELATAINGRVALKFLETKETDLVLLDYEMPEENGAAVLEKIRANEKTRKLPVVFLTGVTEGNKIKEVLALKPQGYLLKPVDMEKVSSTIKGILG